MQPPECPLTIDRDAWIDALESLGIPVRGHRMMSVEADAHGMTVTYRRVTEDGHLVVGPGRAVANIAFQIGLTRPEGGIVPSQWTFTGEHGPELLDKDGE